MKRALLAVVVAVLLRTNVTPAQEDSSLLLGPEHRDPAAGFALRPPANWQLQEAPSAQVRAVFTGPVPPTPTPTMTVSVQKADVDPEDLAEEVVSALDRDFSKVVVHRRFRYLIDATHEAWRTDATATGKEGSHRILLLVAPCAEGCLLVRYACPDASAGRFEAAFDESAKSLRLLGGDEAGVPDALAHSYVDVAQGFSLNPPVGWAVDTSRKLGPSVIFVGPKKPDGTVPNIVVEVQEDSRPFRDFMMAARESLVRQNASFRLRGERVRYDKKGRPTDLLLDYSYAFNNVPLHSLKLFAAGPGERKYALTCTAHQSHFGGYKRLLQRVCDTFRAFPPARSYLAFRFEGDRYINYKEGFSIVRPAKWSVDHGGPPGVLVRFLGPSMGGFSAEISVVCDRNAASLDAYAEAVTAALRKSIPGLQVHSVQPGKVAGCAFKRLDFSVKRDKVSLRNIKLILAAPDRKFVVNCGTRESDFAKQQGTFEKCLESIEIE